MRRTHGRQLTGREKRRTGPRIYGQRKATTRDAQKYQDAFDAWAKEYPEEAEKIRGRNQKEQPRNSKQQRLSETGTC